MGTSLHHGLLRRWRSARRSSVDRLAPTASGLAVMFAGCGAPALEVHSADPTRSTADSTVVVGCDGYAQVAPVELFLECHREGPLAVGLKWRDWGRPAASAVGFLELHKCARCARPKQARVSVRLELSGLVLRRDATIAYRSVTVKAGERVPGRSSATLRYELSDGYLVPAPGR